MATPDWYLLIHQLPARPLYLRARVRARLAGIGAVALKKSVYAVPRREALRKPLAALAAEIRDGGGEVHLCEAHFLERRSHEALVAAGQAERDAEYQEVTVAARAQASRIERRSGARPPEPQALLALRRLERRLARAISADHLGAPGRAQAEGALATLASCLAPAKRAVSRQRVPAELVGRTWVTRRGVQVDRIASAWLIRRFIDPDARFRFVDPQEDPPRTGELRFDMQDGDFTHEDDRCTMETLVRRSGVKDAALERVAEIVHEIDIKDGKFARPEAKGIERLLHGIAVANADDEARCERGFALLDDLHQAFARRKD
jgi:hypothetical protein